MTALRPYDQLTALLDLEPNWNSYGANRVSPESVAHAQRFGKRLPRNTPLPSIGANPDGLVQFEWESGLILVFLPTGMVHAMDGDWSAVFKAERVERGVRIVRGERWV